MHSFEKMENNINMKYIDLATIFIFLLKIILPLALLIYFILKSSIHIIITSNINNKDVEVKVSIRYLFNLINITKTIYPISKSNTEKKETKEKEDIKSNSKKFSLKMIEIQNLIVLYRIVRKVKVTQIYSDLNFGSENIQFTSFIYVLVNSIYGNVDNYLKPKNMYLRVIPCYNQNYIRHKGIVHISPTIKDIVTLTKGLIKIYIQIRKYEKVKYGKEAKDNEISKLNKKLNGYNT